MRILQINRAWQIPQIANSHSVSESYVRLSLRRELFVCVLVLWLVGVVGFGISGCMVSLATKRIEIWEGPMINNGRMAATLGATVLDDGRVVVVGGSLEENPFVPYKGKKSIEIADRSCILSEACIQARHECQCWRESDIDMPYRVASSLYRLPDGRLIVFASTFAFDPKLETLEPEPPDADTPTSGSVAAVIIDLQTNTTKPIYRPKFNKMGELPLKKGDSAALLQRVFERSLQLRDGRIVRIGGELRYTSKAPDILCQDQLCAYCKDEKCETSSPPIRCTPETKTADCPKKWGDWIKVVLDEIEIYKPPDAQNALGSVVGVRMKEARASVGAIQLQDGRVLITGGWGPKGDGQNQNYITNYFLDPDSATLTEAPNSLYSREDHAMAMLRDGRILITGGTDENAVTRKHSEIFDPQRGIFVYAQTMTISREDHVPIMLGPWWLFIGGEDNSKTDLIRNTAEAYQATTGDYVGPIFLYPELTNNKDQGMAGIDGFATVTLDPNTIMIIAGQQGQIDRDGDYISYGSSTRRTLILRYKPL